MVEVKEQVSTQYSGYVGLNTNAPGFDAQVMIPQEIIALFNDKATYDAPFAYPKTVADPMGKAPVFSCAELNDGSITLKAEIVSTRKFRNLLTCIATEVVLPRTYHVYDQLTLAKEIVPGFGPGSFHITTVKCTNADDVSDKSIEKFLGVKDRPGLYFKIKNSEGGFHADCALFFPAQAKGMNHCPVKNGEMFVLVRTGKKLTPDLVADIIHDFNFLVNRKSYKAGNNLFSTVDNQPIQSHSQQAESVARKSIE